jgi:hypothetical protein
MGQAKRKEKQPGEAPPPSPGAQPEVATPRGWTPPRGLSWRGWAVLGAVVLTLQFPLLHYWLLRSPPEATVRLPYVQTFDAPGVVARDFWSTGSHWRARGGELVAPSPRNNPLWLRARLPDNVRVEFDVRPEGAGGDVRLELFGDGTDPASGYVLAHGLDTNRVSVIARRDLQGPSLTTLQERAQRRAERQQQPAPDVRALWRQDARVRVESSAELPVQDGRTYRWRVERYGTLLRWYVDDALLLELDDPFPLKGEGHDRLGLSGWETDLVFDNLRVSALDAPPPPPSPRPAPAPAPAAGPFSDTFERTTLGEDWLATAPAGVTLEGGALVVQGLTNRPVWLKRPLPERAVIEFDAWTDSPEGDIKVEAWGDGRSAYGGDPRLAYTATGYVFVFGGWKNSASTIARQDEHAATNPVRKGAAVRPGQHYRMRITRDGTRLSWSVDGQPFLSMEDPRPLTGPRNRHFGFSGWQSRVHFDNLRITPLGTP